MLRMKKILTLAMPIVFEMMLYMLIWISDTAFMGHYGGNTSVTAVGFSASIVFTTVNVVVYMGISIGVNTMVAQSIGAKRKDLAERYLAQGVLLVLLAACLISFVLHTFTASILQLVGLEGEVLRQGIVYVKITSLGIFFNMLTNVLTAGLRGTGNTVTPLCTAVFMNIVHIFLSAILVFGHLGIPSLGIKGIGIATFSAHVSGFIFMIFYYYFFSKIKFRWDYFWEIHREYLSILLRIAFPSGLQEMAFSSSRIVTLMMVMHLGVTSFAANEVTISIESLSFMPGWGFSIAAITLTGQAVGARLFREAKKDAKLCAVFGTIIMSCCSLIFLTIPEVLIGFFIKEPETIALASMCLRIAAIEQPFMAIGMAFEGAFRGAGDTKTPFFIALSSNWLLRIPLIYCTIYVWQLKIHYVWMIMAIQWIYEGLVMTYLFRRKTRNWDNEIC